MTFSESSLYKNILYRGVESALGGVARLGASMYIVYLLKSKSGKYYTGHTNDLQRRVLEHNSGFTKSTKSETDWKVVFTKSFPTRSEAMKYEKWLKTGKGREYLESVKNKL